MTALMSQGDALRDPNAFVAGMEEERSVHTAAFHGLPAEPAPQPLVELRRDVAATRIALRRAEARAKLVRLEAERRIIEAAGGEKELGANETARSRTLALALEEAEGAGDYRTARDQVEYLTAHLEREQAELEIALDGFKERRLLADIAATDAKVRKVIALEQIHGLFADGTVGEPTS